MKKEYSLDIFADNSFGILNRIVNVLNRRRVRIKNLIAHEMEGDFRRGRAILLLYTTPDLMERVNDQLEKLIEVEKIRYEEGDKLFYRLAADVFGRQPVSA